MRQSSEMDGKVILITGVSGFIGRHLVAFLKNHYPGCTVLGCGRQKPRDPEPYRFVEIDLLVERDVVAMLTALNPDYIVHLAGTVFSYDLNDLYVGNVKTTVNILEAIKKTQIRSRVIISGSAAEYGMVSPENLPIVETCLPNPQSPYGMTKLWQTLAGRYYSSMGVPVTIGRIFNVIGRGSAQQLSTGKIFAQIEEISRGQRDCRISVGDLDIRRDFTDISDICSALIKIATCGKDGEIYNLCSGSSVSLGEILQMSLRVSQIQAEVIFDNSVIQSSYARQIDGSNEKIRRDTGWIPVVTLEQSIANALSVAAT